MKKKKSVKKTSKKSQTPTGKKRIKKLLYIGTEGDDIVRLLQAETKVLGFNTEAQLIMHYLKASWEAKGYLNRTAGEDRYDLDKIKDLEKKAKETKRRK